MGWLRSVWARCSWVDRGVVIALALLAIGSVLVRPVWRAVDPQLQLTIRYWEILDEFRDQRKMMRLPLEQVPVLDAWGRPTWLACVGGSKGFFPSYLISAGPDGVLDTRWGWPSPTLPLVPAGDDVVDEPSLIPIYWWCPYAVFTVAGLAISYRAARALGPIRSLGGDLLASFMVSLPAVLGLFVVGMVEPRVASSQLPHLHGLPGLGASILPTLAAALTLTMFGVRRLHAPLEAEAAQKTEAELESELRAMLDR